MASSSEQLTGLLPTIIVAGIATKMTQSLLGRPNSNVRRKGVKKPRAQKPIYSNKYRPF